MGSSLKIRVPFWVPFIRVPYYVGDLNRDPNLSNYPYVGVSGFWIWSSGFGVWGSKLGFGVSDLGFGAFQAWLGTFQQA